MTTSIGKLYKVIREIAENEIDQFFDLIAEIETGDHFDFENENHVKWLNHKIALRFFEGSKFYGLFSDDSTPVGIAALLINKSLFGTFSSELKDIGIYPKFRRQGYGSELLKYCEDISIKAGVYCMYMYTYAKEYYTIAYYGKNGYVPVASLPDVHGPKDEGHLFMRKILK